MTTIQWTRLSDGKIIYLPEGMPPKDQWVKTGETKTKPVGTMSPMWAGLDD